MSCRRMKHKTNTIDVSSTTWYESKRNHLKILFVDKDDQWSTFHFKTIIYSISKHHVVDSVSTNEDALMCLNDKGNIYDIIVVSSDMCVWLINKLQTQITAYNPLILVSSQLPVTSNDIIHGCIMKPFNKEEILSILKSI